MSIRIGIYDFFAYTIPGIFYLLVVAYGLAVYGVIYIDLSTLNNLSLVTALFLVGVGYIVGLLLDPIAYRLGVFYLGHNTEARELAFEKFRKHHPRFELGFDAQDWGILLRVIKANSIEAAMDVEQHNAASRMLLNISFGLLLASVLCLLLFFTAGYSIWNLLLLAVFFALSVIAIRRSKLRREWFYLGIFEAYAAYHLFQEKWIGEKPYVIDGNRMSEPQGIAVSDADSETKAESVGAA